MKIRRVRQAPPAPIEPVVRDPVAYYIIQSQLRNTRYKQVWYDTMEGERLTTFPRLTVAAKFREVLESASPRMRFRIVQLWEVS